MSQTTNINNLSPDQLNRLLRQLKGGRGATDSRTKAAGNRKLFDPQEHKNFFMQIGNPGIIESLEFHACPRVPPGRGEIEIEAYAAGVNFRDVMIALGMYPTPPGMTPVMGSEVAGKVVAVGEGVDEFRVGDNVLAMTRSCFKAFVTTGAETAVHNPKNLTLETAAGIPVIFITCVYGLEHLARLSRGERILIHSAAGGVGLAAIQIAQFIGAEIFATVGTQDKCEFLKSLGVLHIMSSRSLDFKDEIMKLTEGQGVDVVLNSLSGDAILRSLELLRPCGRFIELGKRDLMEDKQIGLRPFAKGLSFSAVELSAVAHTRPGALKNFLQEIVKRFSEGIFKPLPAHFFPLAEAAKVFASMTKGTHIGKFVLLVKGQEIMVKEQAN